MAADRQSTLTRTWGEFIAGGLKLGLFFAVIGAVLGELVTLPVDHVRTQFHYVRSIPDIPQSVPIGFGLFVGLAAVAVYGAFMRPRSAVDRVSCRDSQAPRGGRVWTGAPAGDHDGGPGRHSADVTS